MFLSGQIQKIENIKCRRRPKFRPFKKSKYMNKLRTSNIFRKLLKQIKGLNQISAFHFLALHVCWIYVFFLVKVNKSKKMKRPRQPKSRSFSFNEWNLKNSIDAKKSQKKPSIVVYNFCFVFNLSFFLVKFNRVNTWNAPEGQSPDLFIKCMEIHK